MKDKDLQDMVGKFQSEADLEEFTKALRQFLGRSPSKVICILIAEYCER